MVGGIEMEGFVKRLLQDKRYGFIISDKKEYFFHKEDFNGDWDILFIESQKGMIKVAFEGNDGPKGPKAAYVNRLG